MSPLVNEGTDLALRFGTASGQTLVNADSPLTRLNYFDGKFLRADDLRREQSYMRQLVQFSNQGLGAGVVCGMDTVLDNRGQLSIGPGLAMDSTGRTLLIGQTATLDIAALIDASRRITASRVNAKSALMKTGAEFGDCIDTTAPPGDGLTPAGSLYVICVGHAESLCGNEDVYGRLCEEACVTATDRPLVVEGVVVRALPLTLKTPLATSRVPLDRRHLRSLVASAYFEDERHVVESLISRAGLALDTWCVGAELSAVGCVPLAVVSRAGSTTVFLDAWTVRRERIEAPAKRYWAWRMAMRPWDVFLAHILQFQCQLHEVLGDDPSDPGNVDPCAPQQSVLDETSKYLRDFDQSYTRHIESLSKSNQPQAALFQLDGGMATLARLRQRIDGALKGMIASPQTRVLINGGIVELPSAGYLPVVPGTVTVNEQVRRLLGEGLDLRFCIVRPDYVPHALEQAQHMERISLLVGLDNPQAMPEVDILVPNGDLLSTTAPSLAGFDTQMRVMPTFAASLAGAGSSATALDVSAAKQPLIVHGAGRSDANGTGRAFHFAGAQEAKTAGQVIGVVNGMSEFVAAKPKAQENMLRSAMRTAPGNSPFARASTNTDDVLSRFSARTVAAVAPPPQPLVGIWSTMRMDRDPFSLGVAESTQMSFEFALTSEHAAATGIANHALLRVRVFATFTATQAPVDGASGRIMAGNLSGTYSSQSLLDTTTASDTTKPFDLDLKLLRTGDDASGTVRAQFGNSQVFQLIGEMSWGGQPFELTFKLSLLLGQRLSSVLGSSLIEILTTNAIADADALTEGGALRLLSTSAIELIGDELTRASQNGNVFVDAAERLLFPPPPPPVDDLTVRATLDWVLFHRRRTKRCAATGPQKAPTLPRRYQLYTHRAKSQQEVDQIRRSLFAGGTNFIQSFTRVDIVEFASGAATLVTPTDALLSDWTAAQPGNTLAYGMMATSVTADAPLVNARLSRVAQGVSAISPFDPVAGVLEAQNAVPPTMVVPGTDGVVLLLTLDAVRTTCHDVYRLTLDPKSQQILDKNLLDQLIKMPQATSLGEADFDEGSTDVDAGDAASLKQAWQKIGAALPSQVFVFAKPNDNSGGDDAMLMARGRAISDAVGGNANTTVETRDLEGPWPVGPTCPVITVIAVAAQQLMRIVVIETGGQVGMPVIARVPIANDIVAFDANKLQQDARFKAAMKELVVAFSTPGPLSRELIGLELATIGVPDAGAQKRLDNMQKVLAGTQPPIVDGSHPQQPPRVRQAVATEASMFGENAIDVSDLLVMTFTEVLIEG